MDSANQGSTRKFPSMTTEALKIAVIDYQMGIHPCGKAATGLIEAIVTEVKRREVGLSVYRPTPQTPWK